MKVDFFIVGAPKAGTTSLYHYLNQHIEIEMSSKKEPDFFSNSSLKEQRLYYAKDRIDTIEKYHRLFKKDDVILRGEASVSYLFYEDVPDKIITYNPDAKIIIMLRSPIDRAFSHYLMDYKLGLNSESFDAIIKKKSKHKNANLFYQQYIQLSEYTKQIKRYLEVFDRQNIFFIDYDEFKNKTSEIVNCVILFLGLKPNFQDSFKRKYNTYNKPKNSLIRYFYSFVFLRKILVKVFPRSIIKIIRDLLFRSDQRPKLQQATRDFLKKHFESDIKELSNLLKKDFTKWIK
jgi:hypothetical protein